VQTGPILQIWLDNVSILTNSTVSYYEPWIRLNETSVAPFDTALSLNPPTLLATAFSGDINIAGNLTLAPAPRGTLDLLAAGGINGLDPIGVRRTQNGPITAWAPSTIIVSDASPASLPGITTALSTLGLPEPFGPLPTNGLALAPLDVIFAESGSLLGANSVIQTQLALHDPTVLHGGDLEPVRLYATGGNIADLTLFSPKVTRVLAGNDITDVGFYLQDTSSADFTVVSAGRDIVLYNPNSPLLQQAQQAGNSTIAALNNRNPAQSGDIQISGPGTLEVLAGRNIDLGSGRNTDLAADLGAGINSIGNLSNPALPFNGADLIIGAGIGGPSDLSGSKLDFKGFIDKFLTAQNLQLYLSELQQTMPGLTTTSLNSDLSPEEQAKLALEIFYLVLRDAGRDHNLAGSPGFGTYTAGFAAIASLFPSEASTSGEIDLSSRSIKTASGGNVSILAPGGGVSLGFNIPSGDQVPPGIVSEDGGNISIFTDKSVQVGALRIFTLRGGNEVIWSSTGDIAAGNASKTVKTAPPTRVVVDAQSGDVKTDLAGLATGGGIGVLATVGGVPPGNVDLIAPAGVVDAGDAGIRATGNVSIAAVRVLNASNIQAAGTTSGVPAPVSVPAPNLAGITSASNASAAASNAADQTAARNQPAATEELPSVITVEVVGYEGGEG
jgi:hypothetical protein